MARTGPTCGDATVLDAEEVAEFETWKAQKLAGITDLSVTAYNLEMESQALAYEAGVRGLSTKVPAMNLNIVQNVIDANPYRARGMKGERKNVPDLSTEREQ